MDKSKELIHQDEELALNVREDIMSEHPREECGVFGVYDPEGDVAHAAYLALVALQHRGQESCGIAVNRSRDIYCHKGMGLVTDVFNNRKILDDLEGTMAVGHVLYGSSKEIKPENAQPLVVRRYIKGNIALAYNGSLTNTKKLEEKYESEGAIYQTTSDAEIIAYTIARERARSKSIQEALSRSMGVLEGAYSIVLMSAQKLMAARDMWGFRPLCMGKKGNAYMFASESCVFDSIGATYIRELLPGEVVVIENGEVTSITDHVGKVPTSLCIFEHIYFARPDSVLNGTMVYESRRRAGQILANDHPVEADVVIGVPDSGVPAAMGYAEQSGIKYADGFIKSRYIGRTFIKHGKADRELAISMKLNPLRSNVEGKRVVMVDDSLVRGTTCTKIVNLLRKAGAKEVHVRISSPPFLWPCYYGTDIPSREHLLSYTHTIEQTKELLGADSLGYLGLERLKDLVPGSEYEFCDACFSGKFPVA